jgi:hypothetical protein
VLHVEPVAGSAQRYVTGCVTCWARVGAGELVRVEYEPHDGGRRKPRVLLGAVPG